MKLILFLIAFTLLLNTNIFSQCIIRGKVTDSKGETIVGASVYPKSKMSLGVATDLNGEFSINLPESEKEIIIVRYISYQTIEDTLKCKKGIIVKNYILESATKKLNEVVIISKAYKNNDSQLERMKIKSSSTIDYISAETIKKTGDANVASAVSRITGVSTTSSGLITVRGVGDRYVKTTINGARIPTLDPFTNNIKLDFIPSSLVDNIILLKTSRPDLPGDWAGAYISIETKDFPDTLSLLAETSFGYNSQSTFKDVLSSQTSSTDWLGFDNGLRDFDHSKYIQFNSSPTTYQEFSALGLSNYFQSIGVTNSTPWNDTYLKLGLVQLGLLGNAQINDAIAFQNAMNTYNSLSYKGKAYDIINANAVESEKKLANNWNTTTKKAPLSFSQSFSIGNQTKLFGKTLGYIIGLRYSSTLQYDPNTIKNDLSFQSNNLNLLDTTTSTFSKYQLISKETNSWSGLLKLALKLNNNNNFSFLFMPNMIGTNNVRDAESIEPASNDPTRNPPTINFSKYQFYESRKQFIYQLKTEHFIPSNKIKIESNTSYTNGKSNAPDSKIYEKKFIDSNVPNDYSIYFTFPAVNISDKNKPIRYFRLLTDNVLDAQLSAEMPINKDPDLIRKIKIGCEYIYNYLENESNVYQFVNGKGFIDPTVQTLQQLNPESMLNIVNIYESGNLQRSVYGFYDKYSKPIDDFFGYSNIFASYAMTDYSINQKIRISGGFRIENANIYTDCKFFDSQGIVANDNRRKIVDVRGTQMDVEPGMLDKVSFLPAVNLIFKLNNSETSLINLRFNYSQSVARPSIRELSETSFYDFETNSYVKGNAQLKMVKINNFDTRIEYYFKSGDNISASLFYKGFENHIELSSWGYVLSWINNPNYTNLFGLELEGKKKIVKQLEIKANLSLIYSQSILNGGILHDMAGHIFYLKGGKRPMFGQAPYVLNAMLTYNIPNYGISTTLSYNIQGSKLVIVTDPTKPDIYELPRHLVDLKVSKKIGNHFIVSFKVADIFNNPVTRAYINVNTDNYFKNIWNDITNKSADNNFIYNKYKYGTNYILSLSYKI
ncbi:MAG: carboxypeptidase-like regulatory domain-containing protein [Bacteroidetes bacterium]|nr:carboxypeptidase-like regulatory domain-containing protein [Bacteroidota bacterium]